MLRRFLFDRTATSAAEFAMVLPIALLLLFGIIDVGNYAWELNKYEKATQMGTRFAVVTEAVTSGLASTSTYSYVGVSACDNGSGGTTACTPGDRILASALGTITCTSSTCTCTGTCPTGSTTRVAARFDALLAHMRRFQPTIAANELQVEYRGSGIGYAGDPRKPEIAPVVTVRVNNASYASIVLTPFNGTVPLPDFSYSLTLEDAEGTISG